MRKFLLLGLLAVAGTALFAWTLLERRGGGAAADAPLGFAPADTPFAIGMLEPFPERLVEQWMAWMDPVLPLYAAQLRRTARLAGDNAPPSALLDALADEIEGRDARTVMTGIGLSARGPLALYGLGLVPVLRWELADGDAFRAFIARLEAKTGHPLASGRVGEQDYWRLAAGTAPLEGILAIVGRHLVLGIAPAGAGPDLLEPLLGLQRPARSLLEAGTLGELGERFDYAPNLLGFFDSRRFVTALAGPPGRLEQAYLDALGIAAPEIGPDCRREFDAIAAAWPRASFGYTTLDARRIGMRTVVEAAPAIAADLMALRAPMPALAAVGEQTLFNLGVSLDIAAVPALVNRHADAIAAAPYACPALQGLNRAAAEAKGGINNPGVYAAGPVFRGFHAIVDELRLDADMKPTELRAALVIGSANPQSLLAMAAMALPQAASLKLQPDGSVQPLALPPVPGLPPTPAFISMGERLLGIGIGDGADRRLPDYMRSDPAQQPLLVFGVSGRLYAMMADGMQASAAAIGDAEARAALEEQARLMRELYARWFERTEVRVDFTEHGIEVLQDVTVVR